MKTNLYNQKGEKIKEIDLDSSVFGVEIKKDVLHQTVLTQLSQQKIVGAHVKTRGEVRGGGRKPWRQKGTGRARAGSIRSPLWRGGGVAGRPRRVFARKLPKKQWKKAICMALSDKFKDKKIIVLEKIDLPKIKTKEFLKILQSLPVNLEKKADKKQEIIKKDGMKNKFLIVLDKENKNLVKSAANLPFVKVLLYNQLNIIDILKYEYLIILKDCLELIKKVYKKE